jgi:hypothetical protein
MIDDLVAKHVAQAMAQIRQPADGAKGEQGDPGCLPMVQPYIPGKIYYRGDAVADSTGTFQAKRDTAKAPSLESEEWACIARSGEDGNDGAPAREFQVCGSYDPKRSYRKLSLVTWNGSTFVARRDDPGDCPGDGWQLLASRGKAGNKGLPGPRGEKGERGEPGASIVSWHIDHERYRVTPFAADGRAGPTLDLRELFEQYHNETHAG